jgi:hypothetical protein
MLTHLMVDNPIATAFPFATIGVLDAYLEDSVMHARNLVTRCCALCQGIKHRLEVGLDLAVFLGELA